MTSENRTLFDLTDPKRYGAELDQITTRLSAFRAETEALIARLQARQSEIETSGKQLANLSSRHLALCSSLARMQEALSTLRRAD